MRTSSRDLHRWPNRAAARTRQTFALLAQTTIHKVTGDGETWPKDTNEPTARTTTPVQQVTQVHPQNGKGDGQPRSVQLVDEKATTQEDAEPDKTTNSGVTDATETITAPTHADWLHADPVPLGTQVNTIRTLHHAQETITLCHQWNSTSPPDPHLNQLDKEQETLSSPK